MDQKSFMNKIFLGVRSYRYPDLLLGYPYNFL